MDEREEEKKEKKKNREERKEGEGESKVFQMDSHYFCFVLLSTQLATDGVIFYYCVSFSNMNSGNLLAPINS